jgi:hypothetical protein
VIELYGLAPHPNDDGIYFYGAWRALHGAIPYRDFFFAHPPIHLLLTAALFALTGAQYAVGKGLILGFAAIQGLLAHAVVRRLLRHTTSAGLVEAAGVAACALLLFTESFLIAATDDTGLVQSSTLLAASIASVVHGRHRLAGVLGGLAAMCSLQTALLLAALALSVLMIQGAAAARRLAWFAAAVVLSVNLVGSPSPAAHSSIRCTSSISRRCPPSAREPVRCGVCSRTTRSSWWRRPSERWPWDRGAAPHGRRQCSPP